MSFWLLGPMGGKVGKVGKGVRTQLPGGFATFATFPPFDLKGEINKRRRTPTGASCPRLNEHAVLRPTT
jgi:hypothetical protein